MNRSSWKVFYILLTLVVIFYTPYFVMYIRHNGIPPDFFNFPPTEPTEKPGPNWLVISIISLLFIAFLLLLFFPRLFGFRRSTDPPPVIVKTKLPFWFWIGLALWGITLLFFVGLFDKPKWLINWALLPLWWGFVLLLDGITFSRRGTSLVKTALAELIAIGMFSISGWLFFEYLNFFIKFNWYYPYADSIPYGEFILYATIGSSPFIPMAFEWYHFFLTVPALRNRYRQGPKLRWGLTTRIIVLAVGYALLVGMSIFPDMLFYAIWLGPLTILTTVLTFLGIWTPFQSIRKKGEWTPLILFSLSWFIQGLLVESWNGISSLAHPPHSYYNPGYWKYCIPYVNVVHIFNMPILGYLGYLPFGLYCFIWVYAMSHLMNVPINYTDDYAAKL